jgi:hypothetical protein
LPNLADLTRAIAGRTPFWKSTWFSTTATAVLANLIASDLNILLGPENGLFKS